MLSRCLSVASLPPGKPGSGVRRLSLSKTRWGNMLFFPLPPLP
jgi:hypothetical protein